MAPLDTASSPVLGLIFQSPSMLWLLLAIPVVVVVYLLAQQRRTQYAVRFTNLDLLASVVTKTPRWRRHVPPVVYLLAMSTLLVALAKPSVVRREGQQEATVMLVKHKLRLTEVPVAMRERGGGASSITALRSIYYMTKVLLAIFVGLFRRYAVPLEEEHR